MTEEHQSYVEELAAYVLGSLEGRERARIEAHVTTCTTCARRLAEYRAVVGALPMGLDRVAPPLEAWTTIEEAARRRPHARWWPRRLQDSLPAVRWAAVALAVASLLAWNVALHRDVARHADGPQVEALARRPGRMVIFAGTGAPGASARLFVAADGGHGHLAVAGLKPLPRDRTYQLWFMRTAGPTVTGGTFVVDARGRAWASVSTPVPFDDVHAITVTDEPAPGNVAPSARHVLDAVSWR